MTQTFGITHTALLATVEPNRRKPGQVVAFLEGQLCFFEDGTAMPSVGETVEVMITRPVHPRGKDGMIDDERLTALRVQVVDPSKHMLVAINGFERSGSMCATLACGTWTDGKAPVRRDQVWRSDAKRTALRQTYTVTPGRSGIRIADNIGVGYGEPRAHPVATNVWVERDSATGGAQIQNRGRNTTVRVAGLTRIDDLGCAGLVRRLPAIAA